MHILIWDTSTKFDIVYLLPDISPTIFLCFSTVIYLHNFIELLLIKRLIDQSLLSTCYTTLPDLLSLQKQQKSLWS